MKAKVFSSETRAVANHLRELFRRAGHGAMARVARRLGLRRTYFAERRHRNRFDIGVLIRTLRELGSSPARFFYELEGGGDPVLWSPVAERSTFETRRAVRLAYRRMRAELASVDLVAELEDVADELPSPVAAGGVVLGAEWLEGLDGRRQGEPEAVATELATCLDRVAAALLPTALGIWSSALCLMLELG